MADISEIHEKVLAFLLDWREKRDPELTFTLRKGPPHMLEKGYWFPGYSSSYVILSFWTHQSWEYNDRFVINLGVYFHGPVAIYLDSQRDLQVSEFLSHAALLIGGFNKGGSKDNPMWSRAYLGNDILFNLETFLIEDKPRIDALLKKEKSTNNPNFLESNLNPISSEEFETSLDVINKYRKPKTIGKKNLELQTLEIRNVGLFSHCKFEFGQRATALIGENGCGKTTILRAAALGLIGTGSPLVDTKSAELQTFPKISGISSEINLLYEGKGSIALSYLFNGSVFEERKSNRIEIDYDENVGLAKFTDKIDAMGFGLVANGNGGSGYLPHLVVGYPQRYGHKHDGTDVQKRSKTPNAYDAIPLIFKTEDNRILSLKLWISENWNDDDVIKRKKVNDLFGLVSKVLATDSENEIKVRSAVSEYKIVITVVNENGTSDILYDMLSTGLDNLFGWLGHLISRMHETYPTSENPLAEPAVVFIDEIDNYLHPEIQVKLMKILLDSFPKTQFIFTAHSPFILSALPSKDAKAYRIEGGKAIPIAHFYGQTIQNISYEQFGITKRPVEIQEKIDRMSRAFAIGETEKAEALLAELTSILGDDDPAILDAMLDYQS